MTNERSTDPALAPVSEETLANFDAVCADVEADVAAQSMAEDDPQANMGDEAEAQIRIGLTFVTRMLRATLAFGAEGIMKDEMQWGEKRLPVYGVSMEMVLKNFIRYSKALEMRMSSGAFAELRPYLEGMIAQQGALAERATS